MNLRAKLGPLPRWLWLVLGLVAGYLAYRHFRSSSSGAGVQATQSFITTNPAAAGSDLGIVPQAGSPSDSGATTDSQLSTYGATLAQMNSDLLDAISGITQSTTQIATAQIQAAQSQTALGPFVSETQPVTAPQPGGANAPTVFYVAPSVATSGSNPPPVATVATKSSAVTKPTRYYTYKNQVPLSPGQTVHYTAGKGYYAL